MFNKNNFTDETYNKIISLTKEELFVFCWDLCRLEFHPIFILDEKYVFDNVRKALEDVESMNKKGE